MHKFVLFLLTLLLLVGCSTVPTPDVYVPEAAPVVFYQDPSTILKKGDSLDSFEELEKGGTLLSEIRAGVIEPYWISTPKGIVGLRYTGVKQKDSLEWGTPQTRFLGFSIWEMVESEKLFFRWNGETIELVLKQG